jgi:hypothetical protein
VAVVADILDVPRSGLPGEPAARSFAQGQHAQLFFWKNKNLEEAFAASNAFARRQLTIVSYHASYMMTS